MSDFEPEQSRIGFGWVRHRRFTPVNHAFLYKLNMKCINIERAFKDFDHLCYSNKPNLVWFRRQDYLNPKTPNLKQAVLSLIEQRTGIALNGPVFMLTQVRQLGLNFNPVTFYFCFDEEHACQVILAQITNTPWGERHTYLLSCNPEFGQYGIQGVKRHNIEVYEFQKRFHVSPFHPMDMHYRWSFKLTDSGIIVHMINTKNNVKHFDATLNLKWAYCTQKNLTKALIENPCMSVKVVAGIYWHAFKLWLKGSPFYPHPKIQTKSTQPNEGKGASL